MQYYPITIRGCEVCAYGSPRAAGIGTGCTDGDYTGIFASDAGGGLIGIQGGKSSRPVRDISNRQLLAEHSDSCYDKEKGGDRMETKNIIQELRIGRGMSQEELAEKIFVTRQAVSRWETGETVPNTETLKLLSELFDVSINTLLGAPRRMICQCCGMPLDDSIIGREADGSLNENYCKWCYADGEYMYSNMDDLIEICVKNMVSAEHPEGEVRKYLRSTLPQLDYWKRYEQLSDGGEFERFKQTLISEINALQIEGMPRLEKLNALVGSYVNLPYRLPNGNTVKFLDDNATYLGSQLECVFGGERCFGVLANMEFILVCTYEKDGRDPELVIYKKR